VVSTQKISVLSEAGCLRVIFLKILIIMPLFKVIVPFDVGISYKEKVPAVRGYRRASPGAHFIDGVSDRNQITPVIMFISEGNQIISARQYQIAFIR
jgi:hypothetical protein